MLPISFHKGKRTNGLFKIMSVQSIVLLSKLEFMFFQSKNMIKLSDGKQWLLHMKKTASAVQNLSAPDLSAANNKLVSCSYSISKQSSRKMQYISQNNFPTVISRFVWSRYWQQLS